MSLTRGIRAVATTEQIRGRELPTRGSFGEFGKGESREISPTANQRRLWEPTSVNPPPKRTPVDGVPGDDLGDRDERKWYDRIRVRAGNRR